MCLQLKITMAIAVLKYHHQALSDIEITDDTSQMQWQTQQAPQISMLDLTAVCLMKELFSY